MTSQPLVTATPTDRVESEDCGSGALNHAKSEDCGWGHSFLAIYPRSVGLVTSIASWPQSADPVRADGREDASATEAG